jgi:hypothetical protein
MNSAFPSEKYLEFVSVFISFNAVLNDSYVIHYNLVGVVVVYILQRHGIRRPSHRIFNENAPIKFAMVVVMSKPRAVLNRRFLEGFIANVVRLVNIHIVVLL